MRKITFEAVASAISYDPETGEFTRIGFSEDEKRNTRPDIHGVSAGGKNGMGYLSISIADKHYLAHRLAFLLMTGRMPAKGIDHIDGDPLNNKWSNLRECNQSQNLANRGKTKASTSGVKGVTWCAMTRKWRTKITVNYKTIHLGRFSNLEDAGKAYATACKLYFGEFGRAE
ncbi:AP2 domain protein [compost metagenome]